jgi:hypothetical protein
MPQDPMLPVDIVLAPSWWHRHAGITFDEDFYWHPIKRVEAERQMEQVLYDRWGQFGLGADRHESLPQVGPVHLAAGYLVSAMLGCQVEYVADGPPRVIPANCDTLELDPDAPWQSPIYRRWQSLCDALLASHGRLLGDVNWSGVLNLALDLRGQALFLDMVDRPDAVSRWFGQIAEMVIRFTDELFARTGTTSTSVNRNVRHLGRPIDLHSECSLVMLSTADYQRFLMPIDVALSGRGRAFGIHYCGSDPHRFADVFARLPRLAFLDVGWGGDVARLRQALPRTFLNLRLSPVEIVHQTPEQIRQTVRRLVQASGDPWLTGVCCINMDHQVRDEQITAIFSEVESLRAEYGRTNK